MEEIEAYKDSNGNLHEDYDKAMEAQADIIGAALDSLIGDTDHGMTSVCRTMMILNTMKSKELKDKVIALHSALEAQDWEEMRNWHIRSKWFDI